MFDQMRQNPIRATFVMEQHIGHLTYYRNLRSVVDLTPDAQAIWIPVTYSEPAGFWERMPVPKNLQGSLRGRLQVRRGLNAYPADVAFFNTQVPAVLGGNLVGRQPYVISTDITPIQYDEMSYLYGHQPDRPGPVKMLKHNVNVRVLRHAAKLLPWSHWAARSLIRDYGVDPARVEVVAPGVDLQIWHPGAEKRGQALQILFVGGDLYRKGGATLLRAFRELPAGDAELHLVTRTIQETEPGIRIYNHLQPNSPELIALYRMADVFVLPSGAEAFGIAAVEASAAGLPVIATKVGGLSDIVEDGETGYLIDPEDSVALAQRLSRLIADPWLRVRMGAAARRRAEQLFDAHKNSHRILQTIVLAAHTA